MAPVLSQTTSRPSFWPRGKRSLIARRPAKRSRGQSFAILGAGALGLTTALRLSQRGDQVVVFEREVAPGGLAAGFPLGRSHLEKFYHHLFRTDRCAISLFDELGLGDRLIWRSPPTDVLKDDRLWSLDSASSVLKFRPISPASRMRMGVALASLKLRRSARGLEGRTAAEWIQRAMGSEAYASVWEPLLRSKFGERAGEIALPWFWARIRYRTAELGYPIGGFQQLYDSLTHRVTALGSTVLLGTEVRAVVPKSSGLRVEWSGGSSMFDAVVSTLPTRLTNSLIPCLPQSYRERYGHVDALSAMCLVLGLNRKLSDAYWINVNDPGYPFQPVVEHTNFVSADEYAGRHVVYLGNYLPAGHRYLSMEADQMLAEFLPSIRRLNPDFDLSWIRDLWLFKAPFAQPIVTTAYRENIPPHVTPVPGLFLANMFQIYPQDRGQNYSIALANRLVKSVL